MAWLTWIFLESQLGLAIVTGLPLFGLLVYWRRRGNVLPLLVGLGLTLALFVIQAAVTTEREHARRILAGIVDDVLNQGTTNLAASLAPDFALARYDRDGFLSLVQQRYDVVEPTFVRPTKLIVVGRTDAGFRVEAGFMHQTRIQHQMGGGAVTAVSRWRIDFVKTNAGWRIAGIEPLYPFESWEAVFSY